MVYNIEQSQPQVVLVAHSIAFYSSILLCCLIVGSTIVKVTLTANQRTSPVRKTSPHLTLIVHSEY